MEFRRDNNAHGLLSSPTYSTVLETNEMGEIQNLGNKLTDTYVNHIAANSKDTGDSAHYTINSGKVNLILGNQPKSESEISENITHEIVKYPFPPSCLSDVNLEINYKPKNETIESEEEHFVSSRVQSVSSSCTLKDRYRLTEP